MNTLLRALCLVLLATPLHLRRAAHRRSRFGRPARSMTPTRRSIVSSAKFPARASLPVRPPGILVFPSVVKAGIGIGGEYGEGILLNQQRVEGYYNLISASFGFQLGVQERSVIIMFMTQDALARIR